MHDWLTQEVFDDVLTEMSKEGNRPKPPERARLMQVVADSLYYPAIVHDLERVLGETDPEKMLHILVMYMTLGVDLGIEMATRRKP